MKIHKRSNKKKRQLELQCLSTGQFAVIAALEKKLPPHPLLFDTAIQHISKIVADLKRLRPEHSDAAVILESPEHLRAKLVLPVIPQGALDLTIREIGSSHGNHDPGWERDGSGIAVDDHRPGASQNYGSNRLLEQTALDEAEALAAAAAKVSFAATDIGTKMALRTESETVTLEVATGEFSTSKDERISRTVYARAVGPKQTVHFPRLGEHVLGGDRCIPRELQSADSFRLKRCKVIADGREGGLAVEGVSSDPEWRRLSGEYPTCRRIADDVDASVAHLLRLAFAADLPVDIEACVSERIRNKRRMLIPLAVDNRHEIIDGLRDMLQMLDDESP